MENPGIDGPPVEHIQKGTEGKTAKSPNFKTTLSQIQSRPLIPENIDSYAEDALKDLITLTSSAVTEYKNQQTSDLRTGNEAEDAAFAYFGLNNIEEILNHI